MFLLYVLNSDMRTCQCTMNILPVSVKVFSVRILEIEQRCFKHVKMERNLDGAVSAFNQCSKSCLHGGAELRSRNEKGKVLKNVHTNPHIFLHLFIKAYSDYVT